MASPDRTPKMTSYREMQLGQATVAQTDGFVSGQLGPPESANEFSFAMLLGSVDGALIASATAGTASGFSSNWNYLRLATANSFLMPVAKGATWEVSLKQYANAHVPVPASVRWMSLGETGAVSKPAPKLAMPVPQWEEKPWENFDPAVDDLVAVFEQVFEAELAPPKRDAVAAAIKKLI